MGDVSRDLAQVQMAWCIRMELLRASRHDCARLIKKAGCTTARSPHGTTPHARWDTANAGSLEKHTQNVA